MEVYFNLSIWEDTYKALFDHKYINFKIIKAPTAIRAPRLSTGTDVHKGFNKHTESVQSYLKNAHFSTILFCGTMYSAKEDFAL